MSIGRQSRREESSGTSRQDVFQPQASAYQDLLRRGQDFSQGGTFIGPTAAQQAGQQMRLGSAGFAGDIAEQAGQAQSFLLGGGAFDNPYLQQATESAIRPIFENLQRNVLPGIGSEAIGAGQLGGSRQGIAEGLAAQGALQSAGDVSGDIYSQAYGQGLQALQGALGLAGQTAQLGQLPGQIVSGVGAEQRGFQQEQALDPYIQLQRLRDLIGPLTTLTESQQTGTGSGSGFNLGIPMGGGGGGG